MLQAARTMPDTLAHPAAADARPDLIVVQGVSKRFGSTAALQDVSLRGRAGSIHAITGENGAGKSTLMKLLAGVHQPDAGEIRMAGQRLQLRSPAAARAAGISTVFQELTVLPNLTVAENLVLGREPRRAGLLDHAAIHSEAQAVLSRIGITLDPQRSGASLTVGEQQLVEIAKGVSTDAQVFIFDEPTAPLNRAEVDKLEQLLHALKAQDKLVFYISHRLDEIFRLCDTVSVLKDGRWVATEPIGALTSERLITLMVGRELQALFPPRASTPPGVAALDVRSLTPLAGGASARLQLRRGEIVGLGGLEGQGQREIVRALAGALPPAACDVQRLGRDGQPQAYDPRQGVAHVVALGIGLVPEDRKLEGLYLDLPIADNIWLGLLRGLGLVRRAPRQRAVVTDLAKQLQLRAGSLTQDVGDLSGGNQQKVMIGRWLAAGVDTLLVEQPTRGVDVGAKAEIHALIDQLAREGSAILLISSELPELLRLSSRIVVVRAGRLAGEVSSASATQDGLLRLMAGIAA